MKGSRRGRDPQSYPVSGQSNNIQHQGFALLAKPHLDAVPSKMFARTFSHACFTIWIQPRATIRRIVDLDPYQYVGLIAATFGTNVGLFAWFFYKCAPDSFFTDYPPRWSVAFGAAGAAIVVIGLYFSGFFFRWAGKILGGVANYAEVRAALAWSWVPLIFAYVLFTPVEYGLSKGAYAWWTSKPHQPLQILRTPWEPFFNVYLGAYVLIALAVQVWWLMIRAKCLGEVNRFSAWLGLAVDLLGFVATVLGLTISMVAVWAIFALIHVLL